MPLRREHSANIMNQGKFAPLYVQLIVAA